MRSTIGRLAVPLLMMGVACSRAPSSTASSMNADLQRDLKAASSASLELASEAHGYQPTRFVSAIEQSEKAVPMQRRPTPKPVVHDHSSMEPQQEKAPDPQPEVAVEGPKAQTPEQPATASDAPNVPVVAPRPAPVPIDYPSSGDASRGRVGTGVGTDIGTIIGVIIRGGGVGDDHCAPPRRRGGRPPFPIPLRGLPLVRSGNHR